MRILLAPISSPRSRKFRLSPMDFWGRWTSWIALHARVSAANRFVTELSGNVFVETTGRMGIEKHFGEMISASLSAFISRLENDARNVRKNLFGGAEFRIHSRIGRHTVVAITYRYWDNAGDFCYWDSTRSTMLMDDFNQDRVALEFFYRR